MALSPVSPLIGLEPARTIFKPLYPFGLWEAVTMIPPSAPRMRVKIHLFGTAQTDVKTSTPASKTPDEHWQQSPVTPDGCRNRQPLYQAVSLLRRPALSHKPVLRIVVRNFPSNIIGFKTRQSHIDSKKFVHSCVNIVYLIRP